MMQKPTLTKHLLLKNLNISQPYEGWIALCPTAKQRRRESMQPCYSVTQAWASGVGVGFGGDVWL